MMDIKFIRNQKEEIAYAIINKGIELDLEDLLKKDDERKEMIRQVEKLQAVKNALNFSMQKEKDESHRYNLIEEGKLIKKKILLLESELEGIEREIKKLIVRVPNIISDDTPVGKSAEDNQEIFRWGKIPEFNFPPKDHVRIGIELDVLDLERGSKVAGRRGYFIKNEGVSLQLGFMMYAISKMISHGYTPMIPPTLVRGFSLFGSGYFKGEEYDSNVDEIYQIASSDRERNDAISKERKFLVGTAEPSLLAYYANEILDEKQLPIKLCGFSQCYRSETGSYGKDTKGIYRVHEFMKVEQVVITRADIEESDKIQQGMVSISKEMHEELGLPYRQLQICTGDMSPGKYKMFDLEAWLPGMNCWGETGSASNFLDWQARRLNVRYKDLSGKKKFVYMLNNTALPSPRIFIAILENYQQEDGSVVIPDVLKKFMPSSFDVIKKK